MLQPKLNSFFGFKEVIGKMRSSIIEGVDNIDEALALTAVDLTILNSLFENVVLRNILQKEVGELTTKLVD